MTLLECPECRHRVSSKASHCPNYLFRLLHDEVDRRESKQLSQRLRRANFEAMKSIEDFDFQFNPNVPKAKVLDLATCQFVERKAVVIVGKTGVGKSHLAQALGQRLPPATRRCTSRPTTC